MIRARHEKALSARTVGTYRPFKRELNNLKSIRLSMTDKRADLVGPGIGNYDELRGLMPLNYHSILDRRDTQTAIYMSKDISRRIYVKS
jgi:hypothetical protein